MPIPTNKLYLPEVYTRKQLRDSGSPVKAMWGEYANIYLPAEELEPDLTTCGDPWKMSREQVLREILIPAARERWIAGGLLKVSRHSRIAPEEDVRARGARILKAHPWPPGLKIPDFAEFFSSDEYLGRPELSPRQRGSIEQSIGPNANDWFVSTRTVNMVTLVWGKGSGKDMLSAGLVSYVCWAVAQMRNPWFHFSMAWGDALDVLNVAQDEKGAKKIFFNRVIWNMSRPCFSKLLDPGKHILGSEIVFERKMPMSANPVEMLRLRSMSSSARSVEGHNTFFFVFDEADAFQDSEGNDKGREMLENLTTSSRGTQLGVVISWPRSENGLVFELLDRCGNLGGDKPEYWGDKAKTEEVLPFKCYMPEQVDAQGRAIKGTRYYNPTSGMTSDMPGTIIDTVMAETYRDDIVVFKEKYCCEPRASEGSWMPYPEMIDDCIKDYLEPVARARPYVSKRKDGDTVKEFVALALEDISMRPGVVYMMGGDFGIDDDSLSLSLVHTVPADERGFVSPEAYADRKKRLSKHYRPRPLPVDRAGEPLRNDDGSLLFPELACWKPEDWRCDFTGRTPDPRLDDFWGVCAPSGRQITRPVIDSFDEVTGSPNYKQEGDQPVMEAVWLPYVVEDLLLEWRPDPRTKHRVDLVNVKETIQLLKKHGKIGRFRADQWQSELMIQELCSEGLPSEAVAMSIPLQLRAYSNFKSLVSEGLFDMLPCMFPAETEEEQERRKRVCECTHCRARRQVLELVQKRGKIDHPEFTRGGGKGRKDTSDARALAVSLCVEKASQGGRVYTSRVRERDKEGHEQMMRRANEQDVALRGIADQVLGRRRGRKRDL